MKKIIILLFFNSYIQGFSLEKYEESKHKEIAIDTINCEDPNNYFVTIPAHLEPKQRIDYIIDILNMRKDYLYIVKDNNETVGMITLTKREAPSKKYAEKLKLLGNYYDKFVQMMLSDPNLPEQSEGFVLRISLILRSNYRNKGYGKKLMAFAKSYAEKDPEIHAITLDVNDDNVIAIKLYESLGYKKICHNINVKQISYRLNLK